LVLKETIVKIKTSELQDAALDWAVAKCEGWLEQADDPNDGLEFLESVHVYGSCNYSTDWSQGGPIIEREKICTTTVDYGNAWGATMTTNNDLLWHGPTLLIAAMRCYVANKLGDEINVPEELL
jgi:hypothetical protein